MVLQLLAYRPEGDVASKQAQPGAPKLAKAGNVKGSVGTEKLLEAHADEYLVLTPFVAEVVDRLGEQRRYHDFVGIRQESSFAVIWVRAGCVSYSLVHIAALWC